MKKAYTLESVLDKLQKVYYNHAEYAIESTDIVENRIIVKSNKKTKEQLSEESKQRKIEKMNAQMQKYSDMDYLIAHAKELSDKQSK
jgi:hypothetical protein